MRKFLYSFLIISTGHEFALGQDRKDMQPSAIGVHFLCDIFRHPETDGNGSFRNGVAGLAIGYQKGFTAHLDFSTTVTATILDFTNQHGLNLGENHKLLLLELDVSARYKILTNLHTFVPFIQAGIGGSSYDSYFGTFFPVGLGLQINLSANSFILLNAQNRLALSDNQDDHIFLSIGLAGNIGKRKKDKQVNTLQRSVVVPPKDTDGDGIIDPADACPTVPGVLKYKGCPIPDRDGDGINDEEDKCPEVPGVLRYQGCPVPDRDRDGMNDETDRCPDQPGPISNQGCTVSNIDSIMNRAAQNCFFATGSYELLPESFPALNQAVQILRQNPALHLKIEGHTDNIGKSESNQRLSENRARAVVNYLTSKGISPTRLSSAGFGDTRPLADNRTKEGRARNRRVEIKATY